MPTPSPDGSSPLPEGLAPSPLSSRSWMEVQLLTTTLGGPGQWTPIGDPPNKAIPWLAAGRCAPMGQHAKVGGEKSPCLGFWGTCKCHQLPGNSSLILSFSILFVFFSQSWALGRLGLPWGEKGSLPEHLTQGERCSRSAPAPTPPASPPQTCPHIPSSCTNSPPLPPSKENAGT